MKVHAVYENGVFRPTEPVDLPERARVEFEPRVMPAPDASETRDGVYAILSQRWASGETDTAARHNEHQP